MWVLKVKNIHKVFAYPPSAVNMAVIVMHDARQAHDALWTYYMVLHEFITIRQRAEIRQ